MVIRSIALYLSTDFPTQGPLRMRGLRMNVLGEPLRAHTTRALHRLGTGPRHRAFGGKGSQYQWQEGDTSRWATRVQKPMYDQMLRGLIGQMARPPETAISVPLQQAISQHQAGKYDVPIGMARRLGGAANTGAGFPAGSFLPNAPGGQQGLQTREQLGLPPREEYFTFMPRPEDIAAIGLSPIRSSIKGKEKSLGTISRLEKRSAAREAMGKDTTVVKSRIEKEKERLKKNTGELYYPRR
jgi:hypothetical protein